jgi:LEA14-like dessication related protein
MTRTLTRVPLIALCLLALTLPACQQMKDLLAAADKPTAKVTGVGFDSLSLSDVGLTFDVEVANPYTVPLPLVNLDYALSSGGGKFLDGKADVQGTIPAKGSKTIKVPAKVNFASLMSVVKGVRPGQVVPYTAELGLSVDAPAVGKMTLPLKKEGELPVPAAPKVELSQVAWKKLDLQNAEAVLHLNVTNTNDFPVDLSKLAYDLKLGGTAVAAASVAKGVKFAKGGAGKMEILISVKPLQLGAAAFNMFAGKDATYALSGAMDLTTPFGPASLPFNQTGKTVFAH